LRSPTSPLPGMARFRRHTRGRQESAWVSRKRSAMIAPERDWREGQPARRVVITGIGAVTPIGSGREGLWQGIRRGISAVDTISRFDASCLPCTVAAEVRDFAPRDHLPAKLAHRLDRYAQFGVAAARMAVEDSGLDCSAAEDGRAGVYLGTALGGVA